MYIDHKTYVDLIRSKNNISKYRNWFYCVKLCYAYELIPHMDSIWRISRAFYKLLELNSISNGIAKFGTLYCMCEAPGGFAEAILYLFNGLSNESPKESLDILAQSIGDIKFSDKLPNSIIDKPRDVTTFSNILEIISLNVSRGRCDTITADGGIDVSSDYINQEKLNTRLILCEIYIAIYSLKQNGNFVLKLFDCFTLPTIQLLWILENYFETTRIVKPKTSRPCNSERYILCSGFNLFPDKNLHTNLHRFILSKDEVVDLGISVPTSFIDKIKNTNTSFAKTQIQFLKETEVLCINKIDNKPNNKTNNKIDNKKMKDIQVKMSKELLDDLLKI